MAMTHKDWELPNGLIQKKSTHLQRMASWKILREGDSKALEIQAGGGF